MTERVGTTVTFVPRVPMDPANSERTPKLQYLLSQKYAVVSVPRSRFSRIIYDQNINKAARYLLFPLEFLANLITTVRVSKKSGSRLVWTEGTYFALAGCLAARILGVSSVWDNHGNIWTLAKIQGKSGFFLRANVLVENLLASAADAIVVVSEEEKKIYASHGFPVHQFFVLPTCADLAIVDRGRVSAKDARARLGLTDQEKVVLFFGTLSYGPNLQAARYIVDELAPAFRQEGKDVRFFIAGSGKLDGPIPDNARLLGFVPDLRLWLSACDVCVAPLWKGVGILTKVVDSLSAERATVVSPLALEGMPELEDGVNCLVGRDHAEFKAQIKRLIDDPVFSAKVARAGRALVEQRYAWSTHAPRLYEYLDSMMH
jgi:glycosyltransferase involved in cell wall biosynthesis